MKGIVALAAACLLALATWSGYQSYHQYRRKQGHALGHDIANMLALRAWIEREAALDAATFSAKVGTGLVVQATSLRTTFQEIPPAVELRDMLGHPFWVAILPEVPPNSTPGSDFNLKIWSCGQNGTNQLGRGDDMGIAASEIHTELH